MNEFRIGYEETTGTGHISGSHRFSHEEIEAFLKHFEKRHNCTIPCTDLMTKLIGGQPLSTVEEEQIKESVGTKIFKDFIDYVNMYQSRKYQHSMRPGCLIIAEKLQKIAAQITVKPRNQYTIEQLLAPVWKVKMPKSDVPRPIKVADISKAIQERNRTNHQAADYEIFKTLKTWKKIDDFEIKYNPEKEKVLFRSSKEDWYVIVDGGKPISVQKERLSDKGRDGYVLLLEDGGKYIFYTVNDIGGHILKCNFMPKNQPEDV